VKKFMDEFKAHVTQQKCPFPELAITPVGDGRRRRDGRLSRWSSSSSSLFSILALGGLGVGVVVLRDPVKRRACRWSAASSASRACSCSSPRSCWRSWRCMVYAGAIMVLFVFVIMLVEKHDEPHRPAQHWCASDHGPREDRRRGGGGGQHRHRASARPRCRRPSRCRRASAPPRRSAACSSTDFVFDFELASVLLLVAIVGAVMLSRKDPKKVEAPKPEKKKIDLPTVTGH
jgi:hypothetical protein